MLIDKPSKKYLGYSKEQVQKMKEAVSATENPVSASIQYVHRHPAVKTAVIGIRTSKQLDEIITSKTTSVSEEKLNHLSEVLVPNVYEKHR